MMRGEEEVAHYSWNSSFEIPGFFLRKRVTWQAMLQFSFFFYPHFSSVFKRDGDVVFSFSCL